MSLPQVGLQEDAAALRLGHCDLPAWLFGRAVAAFVAMTANGMYMKRLLERGAGESDGVILYTVHSDASRIVGTVSA